MEIGASFQPPAFSLNNGSEMPPDEGCQDNEIEGLRPEIVEQLESPPSDADAMEVDDEMESGTAESEMESAEPGSLQMKSSQAPIQRAAKYSRRKKKKKDDSIWESKNGIRINMKPRTRKQRLYLVNLRSIDIQDPSEAIRIVSYIQRNKTGSLSPLKVRQRFRSGYVLNPTSGRFINGSRKIVDFAKYKQTGFQFGGLNSTSGSKGNHGIDIPHKSLDQNVNHQVNYTNTKGEKVTISPNLFTGKLDKQWSSRSNGKNTSKSADQMQSGNFLAYLATKRQKLQVEKAKYSHNTKSTRYKELNKAVIDMSEMIAELSTQMAVDKFMPGATTHNAHTQGGKQGEFDQVHQNGNHYYAMECKGGGSSLGGRKAPNGSGQVQQGSGEYATDLLNNYKSDRDQGIQNLGNNMETARNSGNLHYMHAKQTFESSGAITPHLSLKEFDI